MILLLFKLSPESCDKTDLSQQQVVLLSTHVHIYWGRALYGWGPVVETWSTCQLCSTPLKSQRLLVTKEGLPHITPLVHSLQNNRTLLTPTHQLLVRVPNPVVAGISSRKEVSLVWLSLWTWFLLLWQMVLLTSHRFPLYLCPLHILTQTTLLECLGSFEM